MKKYLDDEDMSLEKAVEAAVKDAKKEGILVDFLNKYATVEGMLKGITVEEYGRVMKKEGLEEGRTEGFEQGRSEGEASGRAAEKIEMAKAMKNEGIDVNTIVKVSGLSAEEIEKL